MTQIHNKSTYNRIYNKFAATFLDAFVEFRLNGQNTDEAIFWAKEKLRECFLVELVINYKIEKTIVIAYQNAKKDSNLIKQAIRYYKGFK